MIQGRDGSELELGVLIEVLRNDWIKDLFLKGEPIGIAGGLDRRYEILQGFLVERMVTLVVCISFPKGFLSICLCFGKLLSTV